MQIMVMGRNAGDRAVDDYDPAISRRVVRAAPAPVAAAFAASQDPIIVPQEAYNAAYGTNIVEFPAESLANPGHLLDLHAR